VSLRAAPFGRVEPWPVYNVPATMPSSRKTPPTIETMRKAFL
jgi:hypothetical protein